MQTTARLITVVTIFVMLFSASVMGAVTGKIVDSDGNPIEGASITTNVKGVGTLTDTKGDFELNVTNDVTYITVSSIGYKSVSYKLSDLPDQIIMQSIYYRGTDIIVTADRAEEGITPIAFDNVSAEDIKRDYTVGEFPLLLQSTPNLYSYSDGGASLGYSYTRIRGFDDKRIVTYINGVPLNDPEDHATYFVDLPDFPANVSDIQVQRGVGNSLYGDASFGGTINIVTSAFDSERKTTLTSGYGGYHNAGDIYKQSVAYSSGLVDGKWAYNGRFSKQKTGGYKHNSWYNGWAYYFSIGRIDPKMTTELYVYGGPMRMHLAYWGAPRDEINKDRRYNPLTYSNETDNFNQPHYHLHNTYKINDHATLTNTLYYIRGKGYYEQYKAGSSFSDYNIDSVQVEIDPGTGSPYTDGDLVRQQWVKKSQYGWNPRLDIEHTKGKHSFGGSFYTFNSDHWGQVVWAQHLNNMLDPRHVYYRYYGDKQVASAYAQEYYKFNDKFASQVTAQIRYQRYKLDSKKIGAFVGYDYDINWWFFSPRIGLTYQVDPNLNVYTNFSVASRTPSDVAIYDANDPNVVPSIDANGKPTAKSERVYDFELGGNYREEDYNLGVNLFYMTFKDEIIPYGGINESGIAYTTNADKSVHAGIELSGALVLSDGLKLNSNFSYNYNRIKKFKADIGLPVDYKDKTIPYFPDYIGSVILDYSLNDIRVTYTHKFFGKQYMELLNLDEYAIQSYNVGSIALSFTLKNLFFDGNAIVQLRVDNLFDKKYEVSGYGGDYAYNDGTNDIYAGWAEYYVAPERSIYGQFKLELF